MIQHVSLLTRPRSHRYRETINCWNQVRKQNYSESTDSASNDQKPSYDNKNQIKSFLMLHTYFTDHFHETETKAENQSHEASKLQQEEQYESTNFEAGGQSLGDGDRISRKKATQGGAVEQDLTQESHTAALACALERDEKSSRKTENSDWQKFQRQNEFQGAALEPDLAGKNQRARKTENRSTGRR
jgi:hypothetical protein